MSTRRPPINSSVLEGISKVLGDTVNGLTGPEIGKFLMEVEIVDIDPLTTKWKRLFNAFANYQNKTQISNNILRFINKTINPADLLDGMKNLKTLDLN